MDPRHARLVWRSIEGERFVRALKGENIPINRSNRGSYGNSKVLSPENRSPNRDLPHRRKVAIRKIH